MSRFRPSRTSPAAKPVNLPGPARASTSAPNASHSQTSVASISILELQDLSPEDVEFFDTVIDRAAPTATTFLTVFKAYNDILHERGLDPPTEVIYYKKLLKLSSVKAANWGERWRLVKAQYGYDKTSKLSPAEHTKTVSNTKLATPAYDDDMFSSHSRLFEMNTNTESGEDSDEKFESQRKGFSSRSHPQMSAPPLSFGTTRHRNVLSGARPRDTIHKAAPLPPGWDETSDATEDVVPSISTTPPSYGAATRDIRLVGLPPAPIRLNNKLISQRERRSSAINEDDAWNKIKMLGDEKEADGFRDEKLMERCWDVWRQGYEWIHTTNQQISDARDNLILRLCLHRWRNATASRVELLDRVALVANGRCLRAAMTRWRSKLKERRQAAWRHEMRSKMKFVRESREMLLKKDAWAKWRQSYLSHLSEQHYNERLVRWFFQKWRLGLLNMDHLEGAGDALAKVCDVKMVSRYFKLWKRQMHVRANEGMMTTRVDLRVMSQALELWKKHLRKNHIARIFHATVMLKKAFMSWKAARDRIRSLERRAAKHLIRQDDVLVRAVIRVWKARERGKLLERVRSVRIVKKYWDVWRRKIYEHEQWQDLALAFSTRPNSYAGSSALQTWNIVYTTHQNALTFAVQYHSTQLCFKMLLKWRLRFRSQLALVKQAKAAETFFLKRRVSKKWQDRLIVKKREKNLEMLKKQKLVKVFGFWKQKAQKRRSIHQAEQQIQMHVSTRIMTNALSFWTNRVIDIKLRELEISQRNANTLITSALKKWKAVCLRHVEELNLMESYQDVNREENIRRMFHRWLNAARSARYRRVTLQRKEDELKRAEISRAWDQWRDRFKDERLRPIEHIVIVQTQRNLLFRAFGIWHSKTKSLPAIRFQASHLKAKFWKEWRAAMPQALQAKKARELDKGMVLSKTLEKWVQTYRTKIELKAIARARYLRLPTAAPRQTSPRQTLPTPTSSANARTPFPRRVLKLESGVEDSDGGPTQTIFPSRPLASRVGIASLLSARTSAPEKKPRRPKSTTREAREPSPTRTILSLGAIQRSPRPRFTARGIGSARDPSPTPSRSSLSVTQAESAPSSVFPPPPPSTTSGVGNRARTKLWR